MAPWPNHGDVIKIETWKLRGPNIISVAAARVRSTKVMSQCLNYVFLLLLRLPLLVLHLLLDSLPLFVYIYTLSVFLCNSLMLSVAMKLDKQLFVVA